VERTVPVDFLGAVFQPILRIFKGKVKVAEEE